MEINSTATLIFALIASVILLIVLVKVLKVAFILAFWLMVIVAGVYVVKWMRKKMQTHEEVEEDDNKTE